MKKALLLTTIVLLSLITLTKAQNVFNPNDLNRRWINNGTNFSNDSTLLTANPNTDIAGLQKWVSVRTSGVDSNAWGKDYKAYFVNLGGFKMAFRLMYPRSYTNPDSAGKKYPVMLFFHGAGEPGCTSNGGYYNNEKQMVHGGGTFRNRVVNNQFDGFLLYPQVYVPNSSCWSDWGVAPFSPYYNVIINVMDSLAKYTRLDIDRVFVDGLSNGGAASWSITSAFPQRVAKAAPSAAATGSTNFSDFVHIPIWFATGGKDTNPTVGFATSTFNSVKNAGADIRYTLYPDLGHAVWTTHWNEPDFVPFMNDMHKANPLVYFQRYDFCPDSLINARVGITAGFFAYEWQRDGVTIATSTNGINTIVNGSSITSFTGNELVVRSYGSYRVRFRRTSTSDWSIWSPKPAVIYPKPVTQTPPITVNGLKSKVLPAPDGSNSVPLQLPTGFSGYQWVRVFDNAVVGTNSNTFTGPAGQYKARVLEQFGCGSLFSPVFTVVSASGNPKPDAAKNLTANANSVNGIQLDWNENPNSGENETGFEIYRSLISGANYELIAITAPNVITYLDQNLNSDTRYYYLVRAVGNFGAAANSNEASARTAEDITPPTSPSGLTVTCANRTTVGLKWNASTDNLGVDKYDIYINGVKSYTTSETRFSINELVPLATYSFYVKARDRDGNESPASNQVVANTSMQGLCFKYYEIVSGLVAIPNYAGVIPVDEGITNSNPTVFPSSLTRADNMGYIWEGNITIPAGTTSVRFRTCSDDGTKLYFNMPYNHNATATVNNDGLHGAGTCVTSATISVTPGVYPLALSYFEATGGNSVDLTWSFNGSATFNTIPASAFTETFTPAGTAPEAPSRVEALSNASNRVNITWADNSNNETGFEITRSTTANGTFLPVNTVNAGVTNFSDSGLSASTTYYYKVRSIGAFGQSAYAGSEVDWNFNGGSLNDALGHPTRLLAGGGGALNPTSSTDRVEGDASMFFDGGDFLSVTNSSSAGFPSDGGYNQRTISFWMKTSVALRNTRRILFDFGGSDNGIGLRTVSTSNTDSADLEARVVSNVSGTAVGTTITLANFQLTANWVGNGWNHIAVVYNKNTIRLYLNGVLVASNTSLAFSSIGAAGSTSPSRLGMASSTGSGIVFNDATGYSNFIGWMDDFQILSSAATAAEVTNLRTFTHGISMDTTGVAPAAPATPGTLTAQIHAKDIIRLNWTDNSANETGFEIWRAVGTPSNFRLVRSLPSASGGTMQFNDSSLFANVTYYYQVRAVGLGGNSGYSNMANATTLNTPPVMSNVLDFTMKFGTSYSLPVNATDEDGDALTFTYENIPYFASVQNVNNGTINLVNTPTIGDQGAYTITVMVDDGHNGRDTTFFTMVVNDNTVPTMDTILNRVMNEGASIVVPLRANDAEGNAHMIWSFDNLPSFAKFVDSSNGRGSLTFRPTYAASGNYRITAFVDDGNGAWTSRVFEILVNEFDPNESIRVNMKYFTGNVATWNDVDLFSLAPPFNRPALVNTRGQVTTVGINALSSNYGASSGGAQTGNNSGVFPDNIMRDGLDWGKYNTGSADTLRLRVYGLDTARRYNFVFMASSTDNCCGINSNTTTRYIIGSDVAQVRYLGNTTETDTLYQVKPNAAGEVIITMVGDAAGLAGGVLSAMMINAAYDDGTTPAKPLDLQAVFAENEGVRLTWVDRAYNEYSYKVYRSTALAGPYSLISGTTQNSDSTQYFDRTAQQFTAYYYYVVGANNYGEGQRSDTVFIVTGNNKPVISGLANFMVKVDNTYQLDFTVTDLATDNVQVSIDNRPSFVTLTSLGSGNYRIVAAPNNNHVGQDFLTIRAVDNKGGTVTAGLIITVTDKNVRSVFVNFGEQSKTAPKPWNNFLHYGNAGSQINNLRDEADIETGFNLQVVQGWSSMFMTGHMTGNNSGVVTDSVLQSGIYYDGAATRQLVISGLNNAKRYNIVVIGSQNEGLESRTRITTNVGAQVDTLDNRNNTNQTGNLNFLTPSAGSITVNLAKMSAASAFIFLNGLIIEEFEPTLTLMAPANLYVEPRDKTTTILSWSDRSNNENTADGFQIQRADDSLFSINAVSINLGGNNTTFTNTGLTSNKKYWYRVRAKNGPSTFSGWSNAVSTITPQSRILVNFNQSVTSAPSPWNNLADFPDENVSFANLQNQENINSGYTIRITRTFNGENNAGRTTGNNSGMGGLVPDLVLQSGYWIDNQQLSQMKISGLNQAKKYRIGYISSSNWIGGNLTATFTVNNRTVYINSWQNTTKIVYIGDLQADVNGELTLDFSSTEAAGNAYSSGIILEAYDDVNGGTVLNSTGQNQLVQQTVREGNQPMNPIATIKPGTLAAYPNPFTDYFNLDFNNITQGIVTVEVYDISGKQVINKNYGTLPEGAQTLQLSVPGGKMAPGVYTVTLSVNGKAVAASKLVKAKS